MNDLKKQLPKLTGCEILARAFGEAGRRFPNSAVAVLALARVLTTPGSLGPQDLSDGFKPIFQEPGQGNHFTAVFTVGFLEETAAQVKMDPLPGRRHANTLGAIQLRDWLQDDAQDMALNPIAYGLGVHVAREGFAGVEDMIRSTICEQP